MYTLSNFMYSAFNGNFHNNFFPNRWELLSNDPVAYSRQRSKRIADVIRDKEFRKDKRLLLV